MPERTIDMRKNIILISIIVISITVMLIYRSVNQDYNFILEDDTRLYELNDAEKEWIENNKLIRIGVSDQTLPLLSWDKNGLPIGLF
jgi:hypothetical protein